MIPHIHSEDFSYMFQDNLKTGIVKDTRKEMKACQYDPILSTELDDTLMPQEKTKLINWLDNKIDVLVKQKEFSYCQHNTSKHRMWILNKYIYREKDGYHCEDSTDYHLPVRPGDRVSVVEETGRGYLIKKDGITGWYYGELEIEHRSEFNT
jgi:protein phosphatase